MIRVKTERDSWYLRPKAKKFCYTPQGHCTIVIAKLLMRLYIIVLEPSLLQFGFRQCKLWMNVNKTRNALRKMCPNLFAHIFHSGCQGQDIIN